MHLTTTTDEVIEQFLQEAASTMAIDQRQNGRYPFFCPVTITPHDAAETKLSAFMRNISRSGIGLLHNGRLETQRVTLTIPTIGGRSVDIQSKITWCKSFGEGLYASGGPFTRIWAETLPDRLL